MAGKTMTCEEVMKEIRKDRAYYRNSQGGVTFSGGEPLLQKDFITTVLATCKEEGIHTAIDTAGNVPWETFEAVLPHIDLFLYDIKVADAAKHREATGVYSGRILDNLRRLSSIGARTWVRVPVIPTLNDTPEEMEAIAELLMQISPVEVIELLPYHRLG